MRILLIDNYDSFTYNLFHLIKSVCTENDSVDIVFNDKLAIHTVSLYDRIIISPGSGLPSEIGILKDIISHFENRIPILGICLGHQAVGESYGATIFNMDKPAHGIKTSISINDHSDLFRGIDDHMTVGRYHSWLVSASAFPNCLRITATDDEGNIMAISHREYAVYGVQFHPESFITEYGEVIISNFLNQDKA